MPLNWVVLKSLTTSVPLVYSPGNDHNGKLEFVQIPNGAKVEIDFKLNGN